MDNNTKIDNWLKVVYHFILYLLVLGFNTAIIYMQVTEGLSDISVAFWTIYGAIMGAAGIPVVFQGAQKAARIVVRGVGASNGKDNV